MAKQFAKTTQLTIPLRTLTPGLKGPFTSGTLPAALSGYQIDFQNDGTWPTNGNDVCTITVEQSNDSGQSWVFDASVTLSGQAWTTKQGTVVNTIGWSVSLDNQGSTGRQIRVSVNVLQTCTLGATVSSLS